MAQSYAKDQPIGFTNRINKVAIVGVSVNSCLHVAPLADTFPWRLALYMC